MYSYIYLLESNSPSSPLKPIYDDKANITFANMAHACNLLTHRFNSKQPKQKTCLSKPINIQFNAYNQVKRCHNNNNTNFDLQLYLNRKKLVKKEQKSTKIQKLVSLNQRQGIPYERKTKSLLSYYDKSSLNQRNPQQNQQFKQFLSFNSGELKNKKINSEDKKLKKISYSLNLNQNKKGKKKMGSVQKSPKQKNEKKKIQYCHTSVQKYNSKQIKMYLQKKLVKQCQKSQRRKLKHKSQTAQIFSKYQVFRDCKLLTKPSKLNHQQFFSQAKTKPEEKFTYSII